MKTPHRPFLGITLLLLSFFLAFSPLCGQLGWALNRATAWAIGSGGTTLLFLGLFFSGALLLVPLQAWVKFIKWNPWRDQERAEKASRPEKAKLTSIPSGTLGEVWCGLQHLGYQPHEFRDLVAQMDPRRGTEQLLRDALKALRSGEAVAS